MRISQTPGTKGSLKWMQRLAGHHPGLFDTPAGDAGGQVVCGEFQEDSGAEGAHWRAYSLARNKGDSPWSCSNSP